MASRPASSSAGREHQQLAPAEARGDVALLHGVVVAGVDDVRAGHDLPSENGVRLAQKMQVGPCIPVGIQL